jgi:hypothetical protein
MAKRAETLDDVLDVLELTPLEPIRTEKSEAASDPSFYVDLPDEGDGGTLSIAESLADQLLTRRRDTVRFLSGHIGSGKSTQLNRLAADPKIQSAFSVILYRIESDHVAHLDSAQLLFLMASEIFRFGHEEGFLSQDGRWRKVLAELDTRLLGPTGVQAREGLVELQYDLVFLRLRQELKLSEQRRRQFREIGETNQTILLDLLKELTLDVERSVVKHGSGRTLLFIVDDLDKVRTVAQQEEIYQKNISLLLNVPFHALYTVPTGVVFGESRVVMRQSLDHVYPVRVLDKAPRSFDPEKAFIPGSDAFFREVIDRRADPALFDDDAVRLAAVYSGGVLRDFFRLMGSAVFRARKKKLPAVNAEAMHAAIRDERRRETMGLLAPDYEALRGIHETHALARPEDRRYLDEARVLEQFNDKTWYEVNPLLWKVLAE